MDPTDVTFAMQSARAWLATQPPARCRPAPVVYRSKDTVFIAALAEDYEILKRAEPPPPDVAPLRIRVVELYDGLVELQ